MTHVGIFTEESHCYLGGGTDWPTVPRQGEEIVLPRSGKIFAFQVVRVVYQLNAYGRFSMVYIYVNQIPYKH